MHDKTTNSKQLKAFVQQNPYEKGYGEKGPAWTAISKAAGITAKNARARIDGLLSEPLGTEKDYGLSEHPSAYQQFARIHCSFSTKRGGSSLRTPRPSDTHTTESGDKDDVIVVGLGSVRSGNAGSGDAGPGDAGSCNDPTAGLGNAPMPGSARVVPGGVAAAQSGGVGMLGRGNNLLLEIAIYPHSVTGETTRPCKFSFSFHEGEELGK